MIGSAWRREPRRRRRFSARTRSPRLHITPFAFSIFLRPVPEKQHPPVAFQRLFEVIEPPLIVGGQAVNLWALTFLGDIPQLRQFEPFTSHDCDLFGSLDLFTRLSKIQGWTAVRSPRGSASPVVGYLRGSAGDGSDLLVEILFTIRGLTEREVQQNQVSLEVDGRTYRTLSPPLLLKAKLANLAGMESAGRQDLRHVQILILCIAGYIARAHKELESGRMSDKAFLKLLKAIQQVLCSETASRAASRHDLDFSSCFPKRLLTSPFERVRNFAHHQFRLVPSFRKSEKD
jgi:hypothetical protein